MRSRTCRSSSLLGLSAALATVLAAGTAQAQLTGAALDLQIFRPAMDSQGFITLNSSRVLAGGDLSFGLVTSWAKKPLVLDGAPITLGGQQVGTRFAIENIVTPALQGAVGILKMGHLGLELGLTVPLTIIGGKGTPSDPGQDPNSRREFGVSAQGIGDIIINPKIRLLNSSRTHFGVAFIPALVLPTGNKNQFLGEGQTIFQPQAILDAEFGTAGRFRAAVNVGMRMRSKEAQFFDTPAYFTATRDPYNTGATTSARQVWNGSGLTDINTNAGIRGIKNELLFGAAMSFGVVPQRFDLVGEVYGFQSPGAKKVDFNGVESNLKPTIEAIAGIKLYLARNSFFLAGGGYAVSQGYGGGQPRMFVGFIFEPSIGDRDGDGLKDDVDKCPDEPEDFDDFEDEDGCPDPDNDKDGILDEDDKCPNDPETFNGVKDEDGCPDTANNDRDGDGIPDDVDKCPDEPEDRDNFEDEDGCPDPDNDKDGILDVNDLCPNDPEDKDGFEDQDGCPDPDNDHDRILDQNDKCPNDPEVYNGHEDEDGCPDKGRVSIHKGKLEILDKIYFETDKTDIKPISFPLLDAIAATIKGNPEILLIEIQGHADERGDDQHNMDLTEGRSQSVRRALIDRGVENSRLTAKGYGETRPLCKEHNEDCWSKNRRVEFIILKREGVAEFKGGEGQ